MGWNFTRDAVITGDAGDGSKKDKEMNRKFVKPIVLSVLFLAALIVFSITTNQDNKDLTTTMKESTLPIVRCYQSGESVAQLHAYVNKMDVPSMRDTIVPVDDERILPVSVSTYGRKIDSIRYEIRSLDGKRLVAKNEVAEYKEKDETIQAQLTIQNLLVENEEYELVLTLISDKKELYYYTRLIQTTNCHTRECMNFALQFHEYTFREDAAKFISKYMDASSTDSTTLQYVDLGSTLKQITWAEFKPEKIGKVNASFKEINDSYNVITLQYVVAGKDSEGNTGYYNIEEYYRLRMTDTRMYVLNFERTMNRIFQGENHFISDHNRIQLGIRDPRIEYSVSETGDVVAFVQEGELWCFDRVNHKIVQVFSFRGTEGIDERENWDQHDIKIARVDEAGSVDFVVYGYMNRGTHEGEVGTAVYHYDGIVHTVEEEVFIPSEQSYEILKAQMGQLLYVNEQGILYLMMNQNLYQVDLATHKPQIVVENLKQGTYEISESNQYFAWVDADHEYESNSIYLMDLNDGSRKEVSEGEKYYLRPLGFIDDDFIYGAAQKKNVVVTKAGKTVFPMDYLKIMGTKENSGKILKEYHPEKGKIASIEVQDYTVTVHVIRQKNGRYTNYGTDSIMNREADANEKVSVASTATDVWQTQYQLLLQKPADEDKVKMITAKEVLLESPRTLSLKEKTEQECFYVYKKGDVLLATENISDAIICANENMGAVVDSRQRYIWMRARKAAQNAFRGMEVGKDDLDASSVVQSVSALLQYKGQGVCVKNLVGKGMTPREIMEQELKECIILDISGCTVDEILFYVSNRSPVIAMTGTNSAVLVTGYTADRIYYYDPSSQTTKSKSITEADEWFDAAGNIYFTYLEQ